MCASSDAAVLGPEVGFLISATAKAPCSGKLKTARNFDARVKTPATHAFLMARRTWTGVFRANHLSAAKRRQLLGVTSPQARAVTHRRRLQPFRFNKLLSSCSSNPTCPLRILTLAVSR